MWHRVRASALSNVDALGPSRTEVEHGGNQERVMKHDLRGLQRAKASESQQSRITWACSDERDETVAC